MQNHKQRFTARLLAGAAVVAGVGTIGGSALAQQRDEILVTATKRAQTIQDVPFSVNAQSQEDIERTGSTNLEELSRNVAGLAIQNLGPGQSQVSIRGVSAGQIVRDQPGVKEQVGIYLDESVISLSLFTPDIDLFDLDRVETLRGPQGTLFGSGSLGGTVRFITNQPKLGEFEGVVEGSFNVIDSGGNGGHAKGALNIPLGDKLALRVVGYHTEYGGFIDAIREDGSVRNDVNKGQRAGGRASLRWEPTETVAITPRIIYQVIKADGFNRQENFNLFANPFTTTRTAVNFQPRRQFLLLDEEFRDEFLMADLTLEADLGGARFTSISSYTDRDILVSRDASALTGSVSVDLGYPDAAVLLPSNLRDTTEVKQFTQEVRLASDNDGPFQWLLGVFYSDTQRVYAQRLPTPGYDAFTDAVLGAGTSAAVANGFAADSPFNSDLPYDLTQVAFFGEATLALSDRFNVTVGGRYYDFEETRTITTGGLFANGDSGQVDSTSSTGFTPRVLLSYAANENVTFNAQASRGFRLGGVNDPLNTPLCSAADLAIFGGFQDYDDETAWNYEVGMKARSGAFGVNAAAFYTDIKNLQVTLDAGSCSSRISFNVPSAHTAGVELEFTAQPFRGLDLSFAGSILESEFDSTVVDGGGNVIAGLIEGNRLASVPELQLAATATYSFPIGRAEGFFAASIQHIGSRFTQPSDQVNNPRSFVSNLPFGGASGLNPTVLDLELDSYQILNINAGIDIENWSFLVFANNVTDENANLAFDRERGGRARLGFHTNQPRTIGVTARYRF